MNLEDSDLTKNNIVLSAKVYRMFGRQRLACILTLTDDGTITANKKRNGELVFKAEAKDIIYSASFLTKTRIMLSSTKDNQVYIRMGIMKLLQNNLQKSENLKPREAWIAALREYGAKENPNHPEEKIDKFFVKAAATGIIILIIVIIIDILIK